MSLPPVGSEVELFVCVDCGAAEATSPQASCCPRCGSASGNVARATATITRYIAGDYWDRDGIAVAPEADPLI